MRGQGKPDQAVGTAATPQEATPTEDSAASTSQKPATPKSEKCLLQVSGGKLSWLIYFDRVPTLWIFWFLSGHWATSVEKKICRIKFGKVSNFPKEFCLYMNLHRVPTVCKNLGKYCKTGKFRVWDIFANFARGSMSRKFPAANVFCFLVEFKEAWAKISNILDFRPGWFSKCHERGLHIFSSKPNLEYNFFVSDFEFWWPWPWILVEVPLISTNLFSCKV